MVCRLRWYYVQLDSKREFHMAKTPKRGQQRYVPKREPALPRIKRFHPVSWYNSYLGRSVDDYITHLLTELGRLGMEIADIESYSRPPNTKQVLSNLLGWMSSHPGKEYSQLTDWRALDLPHMQGRIANDRDAKPRIELSAEITKMNNLSVRWYPGGWRTSSIDWEHRGSSYGNLIPQRRWRSPPDFRWFTGDEEPNFDSRPSNELMFIRGVGNLRPEPPESYGPYATYNRDVVDSILVCAVRAAYEGLAEHLSHNFEVAVLDGFDFETRDEVDESETGAYRHSIHRVVAWTLEDAVTLKERRERLRAERQQKEDLATLEGMEANHGLTPADLIAALVTAAAPKRTGPPPSSENVNRNAAKLLRSAGHKLDAGQVRHIRALIEQYKPELLPEALQPPPAIAAAEAPPQLDNVVKFPHGDND